MLRKRNDVFGSWPVAREAEAFPILILLLALSCSACGGGTELAR